MVIRINLYAKAQTFEVDKGSRRRGSDGHVRKRSFFGRKVELHDGKKLDKRSLIDFLNSAIDNQLFENQPKLCKWNIFKSEDNRIKKLYKEFIDKLPTIIQEREFIYKQAKPLESQALKRELLYKAAKLGHAEAQFDLAKMMQANDEALAKPLPYGSAIVSKEAIEWYTKAANQGHIEALVALGIIYDRPVMYKYHDCYYDTFEYVSEYDYKITHRPLIDMGGSTFVEKLKKHDPYYDHVKGLTLFEEASEAILQEGYSDLQVIDKLYQGLSRNPKSSKELIKKVNIHIQKCAENLFNEKLGYLAGLMLANKQLEIAHLKKLKGEEELRLISINGSLNRLNQEQDIEIYTDAKRKRDYYQIKIDDFKGKIIKITEEIDSKIFSKEEFFKALDEFSKTAQTSSEKWLSHYGKMEPWNSIIMNLIKKGE